MSTTSELATLAMKRNGLTSQYALAQRLGLSAQRVSGWFLKGSECDDDAAWSLGELAGLKPEYAVMLVASARTKSPERRRLMLKAAERLAA